MDGEARGGKIGTEGWKKEERRDRWNNRVIEKGEFRFSFFAKE